ncbi:MAG: ectoine/hydroxyectoine ABC transporter substrate-binding protein EhuB [Janthinobacterium lividum]
MKKFVMSLFAATSLFAVLSAPAYAVTTKERVLAEHKISIGIHNGAPWAYHTPDGKVVGFNADVVRAVFTPLGVTQFDFITADFPSLIPGLMSERFDMVSSGLVITPARCKLVAFSEPDISSVDGLLVKKGNPMNVHSYADIAKNPQFRLGGTRGSQQAKNATDGGVAADQLQSFQDTESTFSALMSGRVDGIVYTSGTANHKLSTATGATAIERAKPFSGRLTAAGAPSPDALGAAFRLADADLRDVFNKRIAEMKADGSLLKIMEKNGFPLDEAAPKTTTAAICAGK